MTFTPDIVQKGVVVNKVYEYRNGVVVGASMREMTFIIIDNCNNMPVAASVDSANTQGGIWTSGGVLNVCVGTTDTIKFGISFSDPDGDAIDLSWTPLPWGSTIRGFSLGTSSPSLAFEIITAGLSPGIYTFFITAKDRHCPLSSTQTKGFTLRVLGPNVVTHRVLKPTECAHKAVLQFDVSQGLAPRTFTLKQGSSVVRTFTDSSSTFIDSLYAGNYTLTVASRDLLCPTTYDFVVVDSGVFPYNPLFNDPVLCSGADPLPLKAIGFPGASLQWFDLSGAMLPSAPVPNSMATGTQYWLLSQQYKACVSKLDTVTIRTAPKPVVRVWNDTGSACVGAQIFLKATGAASYQWTPKDQLFYEPDSSIFIRVYRPQDFTVIGFDTTGCSDTVRFRYTDIRQCCTFSYPTAFTPNGDGKNDSWRPVVYGTQERYELSIFNRWGQVLFHSFIANEAWDGSFQGVQQEVGSYHYLLRAKCITGRDETKSGDFMLVR